MESGNLKRKDGIVTNVVTCGVINMIRKDYEIWKCKDCNRTFKVRKWILNNIDVIIHGIYCPYCNSKNTIKED